MKKCPKCGTILDDSKKKCYMCGADLTVSASVSDFSSNFDNKIGSSITRGVDNVFNNGKDLDVDSSSIIGNNKDNNGSFFSHNSSSRDFFGGEINKLNSMTFDERSKSEKKISNFFGKKNLKSKDEINSKKRKKTDNRVEGKVKKISYSTTPNIPKKMKESINEKKNKEEPSNNMFLAGPSEPKVIKSKLVKKEEDNKVPETFKSFNSFKNKSEEEIILPKRIDTEEKKDSSNNVKRTFFEENNEIKNNRNESKNQVNSAFSMFNSFKKKDDDNEDKDTKIEIIDKSRDSTGNQTDFKGLTPKQTNPFEDIKNKVSFNKMNSVQFKENARIIFNFSCVVIFVGILIFAVFRFIKIDSTEQLDGLQYKVPSYFKLNRTDSHEKFYVSKQHGNVCSFEVLSGTVSDPNGYVENYFQYVKSLYASDEKAVPAMQEMKINGNTWKSERFIYLPAEGEKVSAETIIPRYSYTIITYNGSFYIVRASNKDEDKECHEQYMKFVNSLEFIEANVK